MNMGWKRPPKGPTTLQKQGLEPASPLDPPFLNAFQITVKPAQIDHL